MDSIDNESPLDELATLKARIASIRDRARETFERRASGTQVASMVSDATDQFLVELFNSAAEKLPSEDRNSLHSHSCVIAVGGSGRAELCPYSDTDLLFLYRRPAGDLLHTFSGGIVRSCWDAGLKLGHSQRTVPDSIAYAKSEPQFGTSLVEARFLWGSEAFFERFRRMADRKVFFNRRSAFIRQCLAGRTEEREEQGGTINRLEPDIKRSLGGLRDYHLIRWVGYACHGTADIEGLKNRNAITSLDAQKLSEAHRFLTTIRVDLHLAHGRPEDTLIRDDQLRIAEKRGIQSEAAQRPVEVLMQQYFLHSQNVADISQRFIDRHTTGGIWNMVIDRVVGHSFNSFCRVGPAGVDVAANKRQVVSANLEETLKLCYNAMLYGTGLAPAMIDALQQAAPKLADEVTPAASKTFRRMLRLHGRLGKMLRLLFRTRVLDVLIPNITRIRGLLQFNAYHSYTVDEHTLRAIEACEKLQYDDTSVGAAYRAIRHKATLHLALILHDLGKGFDEDHSIVGERIATDVAKRLHLSDHKRELVELLVRKHLQMSHLAFRRDTTDPDVIIQMAQDVGSPEVLRMLYVLTVSDITAVGPNMLTDWKLDLLSKLYDNTYHLLSGRPANYRAEQRLAQAKEHVRSMVAPIGDGFDEAGWRLWVDQQLDAFPPHYFANESTDRIARDLDIIQRLGPDEIVVEGRNRDECVVEYRVIAGKQFGDACFHKLAGVLSAKRMEILAAQISTSRDGVVVDGFCVRDDDFNGPVPDSRIDETRADIIAVLRGEVTVEALFSKSRRFGDSTHDGHLSNSEPRVVIDAESSDRCTIIDVFAPDKHGLLYAIARRIHEVGLSVWLAKISTRLDQVVDVFYVTDSDGQKVTEGDRLVEIRTAVADCLAEFPETPTPG